MLHQDTPPKTSRELRAERFHRMSEDDGHRFLALVTVREYLFDHPLSVLGPRGQRIFSDRYRRFVLGLSRLPICVRMTVEELSQVTGVDEDVLEVWLCRR